MCLCFGCVLQSQTSVRVLSLKWVGLGHISGRPLQFAMQQFLAVFIGSINRVIDASIVALQLHCAKKSRCTNLQAIKLAHKL